MRKRTKKILLVAAITLVVLYALPCLYVAVRSIDIDPPDDSDLVVEVVEIADEDNAFTYYMKATEIIDKDQALEALKDPDANREAIIAMALKILPIMERGNQCQVYAAPIYESLDDQAWMGQMMHISNILQNHTRMMREDQNHQDAVRSSLALWKLGHHGSENSNSLVDHLVSMGTASVALHEMEKLSMERTISTDLLGTIAIALKANVKWGAGLTNTLKNEYQVLGKVIDQLATEANDPEDLSVLAEDKNSDKLSPFLIPEKTKINYLFQPNRSRQELAEITRSSIREIRELAKHGSIERSWSDDWEEPSQWNLISRPNALGRIFVSVVAGSPRAVGNRAIRLFHDRQGGTRVAIAIRLHILNEGSLPNSLDQLVPNYIDSLPEAREGLFNYHYDKEAGTLSCWMKGNKEDTVISFKREQN